MIDANKRRALEAAGFVFGDAEDFLELTEEERQLVELKVTAMASVTRRETLDDLLKTDGKAELIGGKIVHFRANGHKPSLVAIEIAVNLRAYAKATTRGFAAADGMGFAVPELP